MAKIVVDTPTKEGVGFQDYADALVDIIVNSETPFTIGILGEWGVGKTSFMQTMRGKLKDKHEKNVISIWFNAWRCERERNLAIIPLLQLLVSEIKDDSLKEAFKGFLRSLQLKFSLPGGVEVNAGGGSQNQVEEDLYYDKLEAIETTLEKTNKKIVVFIDDLDRCAPDKILEVLESTKVFLDIKGIVYVLGLNSEVVVTAIDQKYQDRRINGEEYLEKIIQIPFRIPNWNVSDRAECLTYLVDREIDDTYKETFRQYKDIMQDLIGRTPRQVKRFINSYICEHAVFKGKGLDTTNHLVLTILKFKWYDFYQKLFDERYRQNLREILSDENKLREELKDKKGLIEFINSIKRRETMEKIIKMSDTQLSDYRRAGMYFPQKIIKSAISHEELIKLFISGKVSEFNALRDKEGIDTIDLRRADLHAANLISANFYRADLYGANLSEANLRNADLSMADLSEADLRNADLSMANLREANLHGADLNMANLREANLHGADLYVANLSKANLYEANLNMANLREANLHRANLSEANLSGTDLSEANLSGTDLSGTDLSGTDLSGTDLSGTDLSKGIIIVKEQNYQEASVSDANFEHALINDSRFLEYLRENGAKNVPDEVSTKDEFINEMKKRGLDVRGIEQFFDE